MKQRKKKKEGIKQKTNKEKRKKTKYTKIKK